MTGALHLAEMVRADPVLGAIWSRWEEVALPDAWIVAGALAQTVWNWCFHKPPGHGISDLDLVYFDAADLSAPGEEAQAARIRGLFPDLPVWMDVKNEARVHLWYEARFGAPIPPYASTRAAIATFPTTATAVGIRPVTGGAEIHAPFGLDDLLSGRVRPNRRQITRATYEAKTTKWRRLWPELVIAEW